MSRWDENFLRAGLEPGDAVAQAQCRRWQELCVRFLPVTVPDALWRYSRAVTPRDPEQGWKLHVSATVLTACEVLQRVASCLCDRQVLFKAPASLQTLSQLNAGLFYGYSQVGKFLSVYPQTEQEAVQLARCLHELTCGLSAPLVPFDLAYCAGSCVYYRYGSFGALAIVQPDGTRMPALRTPAGELIPDLRAAGKAKPDWLADPFSAQQQAQPSNPVESPLKTTFKAFRALAQRGKGGVYQALDLSASPPRLCILKEGRRSGETRWDGRDGAWLVRNEERVLRQLRAAGINVPEVYAAFEVEENYYLATEFVAGENLHRWLSKRRRRLVVAQALRYSAQLARLLARIHTAGWVWRDCKPGNLILTATDELRPLDFEGACPVDGAESLVWSTPQFAPPEYQRQPAEQSRAPEDLYALGAFTYFLLTGQLPASFQPEPIARLRRQVPASVIQLVGQLLSADPQQRPDAAAAAQRFDGWIHSLN